MDLGTVKHYSYSDLEEITRSFSGRNCKTRHGRLFEGKINSQDVIVKTWDFSFYTLEWCPSHADRFIDELTFLRDPNIKSHPSTVNLIGYHCDQNLAVVYEGIWPEQCLNDILTLDEFKWEDRMKVAIDIGSTLKIFHDNNHVHGGIESPYLMLDKKFCSKIFEFRLYSYSEDIAREYLPYRLMDSAADLTGEEEKDPDKWSMIDDVFTYGILLMELITKQCLTYYLTEIWVRDWIYEHPKSVVHESLDVDEETASKITKLAFDCLKVKQNSKKKNVEVVDIGKVVQDLEMTLSESNIARAAKRQKV